MPDFWRSLTDNDDGASYGTKSAAWRNAGAEWDVLNVTLTDRAADGSAATAGAALTLSIFVRQQRHPHKNTNPTFAIFISYLLFKRQWRITAEIQVW